MLQLCEFTHAILITTAHTDISGMMQQSCITTRRLMFYGQEIIYTTGSAG